MKNAKTLILTAAVAAAAPALHASEPGAPQAGDFYLVPGLTFIGKESARDLDPMAAVSIGFGGQISDNFAMEMHVAAGETSVAGPGGADVDVTSIRLDGLYSFGREAWRPYLVGGVSRTRYEFDMGPNETGFGINLGAGLRGPITDNLGFQMDARGIYERSESEVTPAITMGLRYTIGSRRAAVTEPPRREPAPEPAAERPRPAPEPAEPPPPPEPAMLERTVEFDFDSYALRDRHRRDLDDVVEFLNEYQDATVRLEGFTDSRGSMEYNQRLSERRAGAVRDYLVQQGVSRDRVETVGFGETRPVASNESDDGRQRNRRVVAIAVQQFED